MTNGPDFVANINLKFDNNQTGDLLLSNQKFFILYVSAEMRKRLRILRLIKSNNECCAHEESD